jgi:hypothetical protein
MAAVSPIALSPRKRVLPCWRSLERWHHVTEYLLNAEGFPTAAFLAFGASGYHK